MKRSPINRMSLKRKVENGFRKDLRDNQLRAQPLCEAKIENLCGRRATDVHEIINRSQRSTSWLEPDLFVSLCRQCHSYVTTHPLWARKHALSLASWRTAEDVEAARKIRGLCKKKDCTTDHSEG